MCSSVPGMRRLAAERDQRERGERGEHRDERRRQVEAPVRALGDHVLLADQLAEVGDRLQQAHRPDAVGAVARLHPADQLALEDRHEREEPHQAVDEDEGLDHGDEYAVGHQASTSIVQAPSTGAPSQAKRTAPGASVRESLAGPVVAPPAWRTVTAAPSAMPRRSASSRASTISSLRWNASRSVRATAAPEKSGRRPTARRPSPLGASAGGGARRAEPGRRRGRCARERGRQADRLPGQPGEQRRGLGHAARRPATGSPRARARDGGRRRPAPPARDATPSGARQRPAAGAACGPRDS